MNKLSKIFLSIIVVLVIALGIMIYRYFNMKEEALTMRDAYVEAQTAVIELLEEKYALYEEYGIENEPLIVE